MEQQNQIDLSNGLSTNIPTQECYIPSSVEKKKALMMYFLFGIILVISNKKVNVFEFFHLKQAMWWWMTFVLSLLFSVIILFIPIIKFLGILLLFFLMAFFIIFCKQAWDGKMHDIDASYSLAVFPSLWSWLFWLFNIEFDNSKIEDMS